MLRLLAAVALFAAVAGCDGVHRSQLVSPSTPRPVPPPGLSTSLSAAPATEASARRAVCVAQKLVDANPRLGVRPVVITVGRPEREVFHQGIGGLKGCKIFITEGLIAACKDEAQLAAVLCVEMGKIVAERAARVGPADTDESPIDERIGNDAGGNFGAPDGTRMMEAARREKLKRERKAVPDPMKCAAVYLDKAGYPKDALESVAGLLGQAAQSEAVRDVLQPPPSAAVLSKPVPAKP